MGDRKTIAFFPEASYGPALNSIGIAQACEQLGHNPVFLTDPGMSDVYAKYGFEGHAVNMSEPMPPEEMASYWTNFIDGHISNFNKSPFEQIDNYVKECWTNIVNTSIWAEKELPALLNSIQPDLICVDNVVMFPAVKRIGVPWVRIISCSENEIPDPDIAPHLSGCSAGDVKGYRAFEEAFNKAIAPIHKQFNAFLVECGEDPYPLGQFFEASPYLNLLLYPEPVKFRRRSPLDPKRFQYLDGCVRYEPPYKIPRFGKHNDAPLIYHSFGSLGCGDTELLKRFIHVLGELPYRVLMNVGDHLDAYRDIPPNVKLESWFPQPSVIAQVDAVIHHGGNNTFTECLYFGAPSIITPYVWDGHDNATRVEETGHGIKMHRSNWTAPELARNLETVTSNPAIRKKVAETAEFMQRFNGPGRAAELLDDLLNGRQFQSRRANPERIEVNATILRNPRDVADLEDWGPVTTMLEGESMTSGVFLHRGSDGESESGVWECTPGYWNCHVTSDEFCHFIAGRCTYTHESGEVIEIEPDTAAFFPRNWKGTCRVHETIRKVYMIR